MNEFLYRTFAELIERETGPLNFRLIVQPIVAAILGVRSGWQDAHRQRPIFFFDLLFGRGKRRALLGEAKRDIGRVFVLALVLDLTYQWIALPGLRPVQTLFIAVLTSIVPYLIARDLTHRSFRIWRRGTDPPAEAFSPVPDA
ncbi:MAG: hypothetical protein EA381_02070 [Planctomycetaceae bacterium]|nr:MAG: hypothetical protein EA381_02070 [Planctomycetaceae bacterium]